MVAVFMRDEDQVRRRQVGIGLGPADRVDQDHPCRRFQNHAGVIDRVNHDLSALDRVAKAAVLRAGRAGQDKGGNDGGAHQGGGQFQAGATGQVHAVSCGSGGKKGKPGQDGGGSAARLRRNAA